MATIKLPVGIDWTPEILQDLPPDYRYELWEGNLVVAAAAMRPRHADGVGRTYRLLIHAGRLAYLEQGVVLGPRELVTPDVAVFRDLPAKEVAYHPAREFELVVEVVSPDSRTADRIVKPAKYAACGIPEYWRVEETDDGDTVVHQHKLVREAGAERYVETRVVMLSTLEKESL
ncbi:Uma2 family endonuclease [Phytohabitans sp. LJ34]|uniref:Uma2 family endonuclease n=1 Tax=Phytohabitans sp. LJ34 TaxID=3452217 RepID=UPI003F8BDB58